MSYGKIGRPKYFVIVLLDNVSDEKIEACIQHPGDAILVRASEDIRLPEVKFLAEIPIKEFASMAARTDSEYIVLCDKLDSMKGVYNDQFLIEEIIIQSKAISKLG